MTPAQARAALARQLDAHGSIVTLRRLSGTDAGDYNVRAAISTVQPSDVVGAVQQLKRKAIVSAEDVETTGFPTPFLPKQDRLISGGKTMVIITVDDVTRGIGDTLIGFDMELSGA